MYPNTTEPQFQGNPTEGDPRHISSDLGSSLRIKDSIDNLDFRKTAAGQAINLLRGENWFDWPHTLPSHLLANQSPLYALSGGVEAGQPEDFLRELHARIMGRMAHVDEYQGTIVFLLAKLQLSERCSYSNGGRKECLVRKVLVTTALEETW